MEDDIEESLLGSTSAAQASLERGNTRAAANQIRAFMNKIRAQRGKKIPIEVADMLLDYAQNVLNEIGP